MSQHVQNTTSSDRSRTRFSMTSLLAYVYLLLIVLTIVTEGHSARRFRQKKKRHSATNKAVTVTRSMATPYRRHHHRSDRSVHLEKAENSTLCDFKVRKDVQEDRIPRVIHHVTCVDEGCRCKVVNATGTYKCTQLVTNISVTVNSVASDMEINYACVCASQTGIDVPNFPSSSLVY